MRYFNNIIQLTTKLLLIFFLYFVWVRYFLKKLFLAVIISIILTAITEILFKIFSDKKSHLANLKLEEKEKAENIFLSLCQEKDPAITFKKIIKQKYPTATKTKNLVFYSQEDTKTCLCIDTSFTPLNIDKIISILKSINTQIDKLIISTGEINKDCYSFVKNFDLEILLLNKYETYQKLYKEFNFFPEITLKFKKDKKLVFYDFISYSFNKTRTKGYLLAALVLLISSLFVRTNLYYCISSSILLIFAIISYFNPIFNKKVNTKIF